MALKYDIAPFIFDGMRITNPQPRIDTVWVQSGTPASRLFLEFEQDSVVHQVTSSVQLICEPGVSCAVSCGFLSDPQVIAGPRPNNAAAIHAYQCNAAPGLAGPLALSYQNSTPMGTCLVKAGTRFRVVVETSGAPLILPAFGFFSIFYNPLSEWVNFREPTTAVRL